MEAGERGRGSAASPIQQGGQGVEVGRGEGRSRRPCGFSQGEVGGRGKAALLS